VTREFDVTIKIPPAAAITARSTTPAAGFAWNARCSPANYGFIEDTLGEDDALVLVPTPRTLAAPVRMRL
jgi:inorganic pyrophosphatase